VLVPGLICDAALWQHQAAALAPVADIRIPDLAPFDSIDAMADAVLAAAPMRFALGGLSMGGYVAQAILRRAPERVLRLALLDTTARADQPEQTAARRTLMQMTREGRFEDVLAQLLERLIDPSRYGDHALCETILEMERRVGPDAFLRQEAAILGRPDGAQTLAAGRCPLLLLCGENDAITPPAVHREMHALRPDATLVVVAACGHLSVLERPEPVTAALAAWLAGDDSTTP
jgi:pimeloyl-ACP methyl ester carboxylesterase